MVEHAAVNRGVEGSSPSSGASFPSESSENWRAWKDAALPLAPHRQPAPSTFESTSALGGLDAVSPDPSHLLLRKESVPSSQIEGTQCSLSNLLPFESEGRLACRSMTCGKSPTTSPQWTRVETAQRIPPVPPAAQGNSRHLTQQRTRQKKGAGRIPHVTQLDCRHATATATLIRSRPPNILIECLGALEKFLRYDPVRTPLWSRPSCGTSSLNHPSLPK